MKRLFVLFVLAGCDITYQPEVGPLQAGEVDAGMGSDGPAPSVSRCVDSDPETQVSFSLHIRPLLSRSPGGCTGCHGANSTSGFSVGSYDLLRRGGNQSGTKIIVAGDPCESILPQKLGVAPPFGARMPYSGPPFYNAAELTLVRDWIAEGAQNN